MRTQSPDTPPEIERIQIEGYRKMTPAQKIRLVAESSRFLEALAMSDVRRRYPEASERECRLRVAARRLPADLMKRAFGWDPRVEGY